MVKKSNDLIATRTTLLRRLKDWQDESSWQDFFDTYWNLIYSVALKAGLNEGEAQDAVQETMISVAKHMPNFKYDPTVGSFKGWLLQMTRWRILDQIRRRELQPGEQVTPHTYLMEKVVDPVSKALDVLWDAEWEAHLLDAALSNVKRRLDPQKYQIFDFCVNKEWPAEKVAATFGISVNQVYLAKHRVTELISEEVKRLEAKIV